jgi:methionine salvage enolase-phosphatase E1
MYMHVYQIFVSTRSSIDTHLYADTLPCLQHIAAQNVAIGLFTNGNAKIPALFAAPKKEEKSAAGLEFSSNKECSAPPIPTPGLCSLSSYLSLSLNAGDVGTQKPSMVPFIAISQLTGIPPSRLLYVGDNFEHDVVAAKQANIHTAYLQRPPERTCDTAEGTCTHWGKSCKDDVPKECSESVRPDIELSSLEPKEFASKIQAYITQISKPL